MQISMLGEVDFNVIMLPLNTRKLSVAVIVSVER